MLEPVAQEQLSHFPSLKLNHTPDPYKEGYRLGLNYFNFYTNHITSHNEVPVEELALTVAQCVGFQAVAHDIPEDSMDYLQIIKGCNDACSGLIAQSHKTLSHSPQWF